MIFVNLILLGISHYLLYIALDYIGTKIIENIQWFILYYAYKHGLLDLFNNLNSIK